MDAGGAAEFWAKSFMEEAEGNRLSGGNFHISHAVMRAWFENCILTTEAIVIHENVEQAA